MASPSRDPFKDLKNAVSAQRAVVCCGGAILITLEGDVSVKDVSVDGQIKSPPVVLRWDAPGNNATRKHSLTRQCSDR